MAYRGFDGAGLDGRKPVRKAEINGEAPIFRDGIIKGSLVGKRPNYERFSQPAVAPSCQAHHHVNHIIMSTTAS